MNHYVNARIAEQRMEQTARQRHAPPGGARKPRGAREVGGAGPPSAPTLDRPGRGPDHRGIGGTMAMHGTGLFGRDRELVEAGETLAHVIAGTPQALLLGGDAGIGKTTLVAGVARRPASSASRCSPATASTSTTAFRSNPCVRRFAAPSWVARSTRFRRSPDGWPTSCSEASPTSPPAPRPCSRTSARSSVSCRPSRRSWSCWRTCTGPTVPHRTSRSACPGPCRDLSALSSPIAPTSSPGGTRSAGRSSSWVAVWVRGASRIATPRPGGHRGHRQGVHGAFETRPSSGPCSPGVRETRCTPRNCCRPGRRPSPVR